MILIQYDCHIHNMTDRGPYFKLLVVNKTTKVLPRLLPTVVYNHTSVVNITTRIYKRKLALSSTYSSESDPYSVPGTRVCIALLSTAYPRTPSMHTMAGHQGVLRLTPPTECSFH